MLRPRVEYKKSEASRAHVISAAITTIAKRGFSQTSVSDIAKTAGMSKGVVHYHFKNKEDLISRVLEESCSLISARVRKAWDEPGGPTDKIRRGLREMWATRTDGSAEMRVMADLMAQAVHDPKIRKSLAAQFNEARAEFVREMVAAFTSIGLKPKLPAHIIPRLVMATLDGLGLHQLFDPPPPEDEKEIFRALELIAFALFEL